MPSFVLSAVVAYCGRRPQVILMVCAAVSMVVTLGIAQSIIDRNREDELKRHAAGLLGRAAEVADQSVDAMLKVLSLTTIPCSEKDLDELRLVGFQVRYVRDIVRIRDNSIVCSATWGALATPYELPAPAHWIGRFRFWRAIPASPMVKINTDLAASGSVGVVTAPDAFDGVETTEPGYSSLVVSKDKLHVFREVGRGEELLEPYRQGTLSGRLDYTTSICHAERAICVVESTPRAPLWASWSWLLVALCTLGALAGMGVGLSMRSLIARQSSLKAQLKHAISVGGINVAYQPIRCLTDRRLAGVEALARWSDCKGDPVSPDVFIPLVERLGLMDPFTRSVVARVFKELGPRLRLDQHFYVSVNVSPEQIVSPSFRLFLASALEESGIHASSIALEVTERSTSNIAELSAAFSALRDAGHRVLIDDFGTGYSNFAYLTELPFDAIKMDQVFTKAIGTQSLASEVIQSMVALSKVLGVALIVEGIETEEQAAFLHGLHPNAKGQGWLLGRPVPAHLLPGS